MPEKSQEKTLILASSSPYRKMMLEKLGLPFSTLSPDIDERPLRRETVRAQVTRLARLKAAAVSEWHPQAVVIGCDQLAHCGGRTVGKPGSVEKAAAQLASFSGRTVEFLSALCVADGSGGPLHQAVVPTQVCFRNLSRAEILRYIERDQPLDCAGSFKSECSGPSLLASMNSEDPTAIIGLPLIALCDMLRRCGYAIP